MVRGERGGGGVVCRCARLSRGIELRAREQRKGGECAAVWAKASFVLQVAKENQRQFNACVNSHTISLLNERVSE
jgi:hypothetical protein